MRTLALCTWWLGGGWEGELGLLQEVRGGVDTRETINSICYKALTTHTYPINTGRAFRTSVKHPFCLIFCILTIILIYYWINTCETTTKRQVPPSRSGRPWNILWVCPPLMCLNVYIILSILKQGIKKLSWHLRTHVFTRRKELDWSPQSMLGNFPNCLVTRQSSQELLLPFPGVFCIPQMHAQSLSCIQCGRLLRITCTVVWFSKKALSTLTCVPPKEVFPLSQGKET